MNVMIDWVTCIIKCNHLDKINSGHVVSVDKDGSIEWQKEKILPVVGSYDSKLYIVTDYLGAYDSPTIKLSGNPVKFFQGHNIFGSCDLVGLVANLMDSISKRKELGLIPTKTDRESWVSGDFMLTRVDVTTSYMLSSLADVKAWLRAAEKHSYMKHRGRGLMQNGTLYFGKNSRRWSLKCYSKGDEIKAKGHELPLALQTEELESFADKLLRVEVVIRGMELKRLGLHLASEWLSTDIMGLHQSFIKNLNLSDNYMLTDIDLEQLPTRLKGVYALWEQGNDLRQIYSKSAFYRYRTALLKYGIDISTLSEKTDNVVPLIRVLEAKPASIPAWAYSKGFYFQPDRNKVLSHLRMVE